MVANDKKVKPYMKKLKYVLMIISICLIVAVLYGNIHTHKSTGDFFAGNVETPELEWSVESVSEPKVVAKLVTGADDEETDRTILLRSQWKAYQVWADGEMVYDSTETDNGAIELIHVPASNEIKVEFLNADETALRLACICS